MVEINNWCREYPQTIYFKSYLPICGVEIMSKLVKPAHDDQKSVLTKTFARIYIIQYINDNNWFCSTSL